MPLKLEQVTNDAQFRRVMDALFDSYSYPYDGFWVIYKGSSEEECASRFNKWRKQDPSQHWIYVTDTDTDEVVGATQWNIHENNPLETSPPPFQADWLEQGRPSTAKTPTQLTFLSRRPTNPRRESPQHILPKPPTLHEPTPFP